jgi:hypothetical protein
MKRQQLSVMVALAAALLFACAAHAQQAPPRTRQPRPRTQQNPPLPQTVPTTSAQTMQCTSGGNCYDNNTTDRDVNATDNDDTPRNNPKFSSLAGS